MGYLDETRVSVRRPGRGVDRIDYEYDFGDGWEHALVVEAREAAQDGAGCRACVAGEGACPPEDCGGSPGLPSSRRGRRASKIQRDALLEWAGGAYDPGRFELPAW